MANLVPDAIIDLLGVAETTETWRDRVKNAVYVSPSGTRVPFLYENVSRSYKKRGTVFEFAGVNGGYVQGKGFGPRRYPIRAIFSGPDHDKQALVFEAALLEDGVGKLEHPFYAPSPEYEPAFNVQPLGDITRRDDLKTATNETVVEVTFFTTLLDVYPSPSANPKSEIQSALDAFGGASAVQFGNSADISNAVNRANVKATVLSFLKEIQAATQSVSDSVSSIRAEVASVQSSINFGIDVLVGQPLQLAQQILNLISSPSRALVGIGSRLDGYRDMAARIIATDAATPSKTLYGSNSLALRTAEITNNLHLSDLVASASVAGSAESILNTTFTTKPQALNAGIDLLEQFQILVDWRDGAFADISVLDIGNDQLDSGEAYQALFNAVTLLMGFLVEISFTLIPERRLVLGENTTIINLAAELYGDVGNDTLDRLIQNNNLTGQQILELERGTTIVYYPSPG